ncbi:excinuclease [Pseudomonas guariconensis]|uniref:excinuclease n=1 Tax=Pseudomonas TaxID=286 RepID=UPI0020976F1C|nr:MULTISPECIES: excinuclease [Pseudomonas]MCO7636027.1 excinuclease [Pseudomonas sp. S 311-6]MCO7513236.1 excinuclease [Pseudomonas putida]MCO7563371.1 excinuclease [Pseudomonas mosselii]MCO7594716.1 excinuclease [Pseudomonas guariconensis]MCO7603664.1 excinuclease [Pseudomonas guariconensis]
MRLKTWTATTALLLCALPGLSQARDTALYLPFEKVVQQMLAEKKLDGSVKFYLAGVQPRGKVKVISPNAVTNKKTNAFNKSDEAACEWALQSALLTLQDAARKANANAVTNIASYYKKNERKDPATYECHAGAVIAGVALKGDLARVD